MVNLDNVNQELKRVAKEIGIRSQIYDSVRRHLELIVEEGFERDSSEYQDALKDHESKKARLEEVQERSRQLRKIKERIIERKRKQRKKREEKREPKRKP